MYFLSATTLHANVIRKLEAFDFSETASYAFVHTMYVHPPLSESQEVNGLTGKQRRFPRRRNMEANRSLWTR